MKDNTFDEDSNEDKKNKLCKLILNMRQAEDSCFSRYRMRGYE